MALHDSLMEKGIQEGSGLCCIHTQLAFYGDDAKRSGYLKAGMRLGHPSCIMKIAELAENGEWPEELSPYDIGELWLRAARYSPDDEEALRGLRHVSDPAFLLRHKEELQKYWKPQWEKLLTVKDEEDGRYDAYV